MKVVGGGVGRKKGVEGGSCNACWVGDEEWVELRIQYGLQVSSFFFRTRDASFHSFFSTSSPLSTSTLPCARRFFLNPASFSNVDEMSAYH